MPYAEIQTIEAFGIPFPETRYYPEPTELEEPIITIEFKPKTHPLEEYGYSHPRFVFGDLVILKKQLDYCLEHHIEPNEELDIYYICAMKLVEHKSKSGRLTEAPHWLYGIRCQMGTKELMWVEQEELMSEQDLEADSIGI